MLKLATLGAICAAAASICTPAAGASSPSAPPGQQLSLVLPLRADDAELARLAQSVSNPSSPAYGHYLSYAELAGRFGASSGIRAQVVDYLAAHGATEVRIDPTHTFVFARMSAADAERTFAVPLTRRRAHGVGFIAPAGQVNIPAGLQGLIDGVVGLNTQPVFGSPAPHRVGPAGAVRPRNQPSTSYSPVTGSPSGCAAGVGSGGFTPNQYLTAYGYDRVRSPKLSGQGERVALIEIDGFRYSDIRTFARCFKLDIPAITTYVSGGGKTLPPGGEATLDLEVLDAAAPDLGELEVFETPPDTASVLRAYLAPLVFPNAKPQIISTSVGLCEKFTQAADNGASIRSAERGYALLAVTGVSVLAAAGDNGSADCISGEENKPPPEDRTLAVDYPASSPEVTAVGGTQLALDSANRIKQQLVWNEADQAPGIGGGGGLSGLFRRPAYQNGTVRVGQRALPDASMLADSLPGYAIYCTASAPCDPRQPWTTLGGTSAATPLLAGGVALINQDLHRHGKQFVGFLNPLLYQAGRTTPGVFSDVTAFGNDVGPYLNGGNGQPLGCCTASPGFDFASGWGSVDLAALDAFAIRTLPAVPNVSLSVPRGQHPVRARRVIARMSCSSKCLVGAFVIVKISGSGSFQVTSKTHSLAAHRRTRIVMRFSAKQERRLRNALRAHRAIFGEAFGVLTDAQGDAIKVTAGRQVRLDS
jgi:kumamolisin